MMYHIFIYEYRHLLQPAVKIALSIGMFTSYITSYLTCLLSRDWAYNYVFYGSNFIFDTLIFLYFFVYFTYIGQDLRQLKYLSLVKKLIPNAV